LEPDFYPIKTYADFKEDIDPFSSITSALNKANSKQTSFIQINFSPIPDYSWKKLNKIDILSTNFPKPIKKLLLSKYFDYFKIFLFPFTFLLNILSILVNPPSKKTTKEKKSEMDPIIAKKFS
jgi:hypothetical protein